MLACYNGHDKAVKFFINKGIVDVNIKTEGGQTGLHWGLYKIKIKY